MNERDTNLLFGLDACSPALDWAATQPNLRAAWAACQRGDWLLWLATRLNVPRERIVLAGTDHSREVLHLVPDDVDEPRVAVETAELWALGEATIEEVREARDHCRARRRGMYASSAAAVEAAELVAAAVAELAATVAFADADADAASADADAARSASLARSADIVREWIPWRVVAAAIRSRGQERDK